MDMRDDTGERCRDMDLSSSGTFHHHAGDVYGAEVVRAIDSEQSGGVQTEICEGRAGKCDGLCGCGREWGLCRVVVCSRGCRRCWADGDPNSLADAWDDEAEGGQ
ncbi:hypothetical protein LBMAG46_15760 [Planctomycetia bacterium]|nr:hypothetical protein LBMAG46_15760 [Planctomycetia bacterium]